MRLTLLLLLSGLWVSAAKGEPMSCGKAQYLCECSAVFHLLETQEDDAAFEAQLRERSVELRKQVYIYHGQRAGDAMVDAHIAYLQETASGLEATFALAQMLARCDVLISGQEGQPAIKVTP